MKTIAILSGGLDSTVLCTHLLNSGDAIQAVSFDYGQRHKKEILHADAVARHLGIKHRVIDLRPVGEAIAKGALLGKGEVPHGHYADESMKATVVPNRNMIMLSVAVGVAIAEDFDAVAYGAHAGDHTIYPDCRPEFAEALAHAVALSDFKEIRLERPFVKMTKAEIAKLGDTIKAPMHLSWSCYEGAGLHCGKCGTCVERKEAFALAGVTDPTEYRA